MIEQCTAIHQEIARYRVDALTEADRNQIVDLVYYTTDSMIKSLKTLDEQLYPTNEIDYSYPSTPSSSSQTRPFHVNRCKKLIDKELINNLVFDLLTGRFK